MITGTVRLIDDSPARRESDCAKLRACGLNVADGDTSSAFSLKESDKHPDLALIRLDSNTEPFHMLMAQFPRTFLVPFIEKTFSPDFRREALALPADGFLNGDLNADEWMATIKALLRKKRAIDALSQALSQTESKLGESLAKQNPPTWREAPPLRDREPELYREILVRYEEGVKLVLRNRIYKIDDDVFEPFRHIARQLFLAKATARDAVQLHYHTLRKFAPTADTPGAQAYLEVGRTTIIGLMGDLLTYYRDGDKADSTDLDSTNTASRA